MRGAADITLFDAGSIAAAAAFEKSIQPSLGIEAVMVNGSVVWRDGKLTGERPGKVLRRGQGS